MEWETIATTLRSRISSITITLTITMIIIIISISNAIGIIMFYHLYFIVLYDNYKYTSNWEINIL